MVPRRAGDEARELIERLTLVRERKGMTQAEVAQRMGTSQPYIARLEAATSDPRLSTVLKYAAIVAGAAVIAAILAELDSNS